MKVYLVLFNDYDYDNGTETTVEDIFFSEDSAKKYVIANTYEYSKDWYEIKEMEVRE